METEGRNALSRKADVAQVLGTLVIIETPLLALAAFLDERRQQQTALGVAALVALLAIVWARRLWRSSAPEPVHDDERWAEALRVHMRQTWTGPGSLLAATEQLRQDLTVRGDSSWLHFRFRDAVVLEDGATIDLGSVNGAGGLYEALNGSYLVAAEPGAGKSVLLWQTLDYLLGRPDTTPLLIEAFYWHMFDNQPGDPPSFERFVSNHLSDPALGPPRRKLPLDWPGEWCC